MSFGENLQFLRKMHERMTQEELADKMNVSKKTKKSCHVLKRNIIKRELLIWMYILLLSHNYMKK